MRWGQLANLASGVRDQQERWRPVLPCPCFVFDADEPNYRHTIMSRLHIRRQHGEREMIQQST